MAQNEATLLIRIKQIGGEILDKLGESLSAIKSFAGIAVGAVAAFGAAAIHAFKESEEASNTLTQSMINQGMYTKELKDEYDKLATKLAELTTFQDDEITTAQAVIQSKIGQTKVSEQLLRATLDLAAAKKMDLATAADMVGKTIGTETNALARQGLQLKDNMTANEKMAATIKFLNGQFQGQAEAQAKGLGVLVQLKNAIGEFTEEAGRQLMPVVVVISRELLNLVNIAKNTAGAFDGLKFMFQETAVLINGVVSYLIDMGQGIGATLGAIAGAASLAAKGQISDAVTFLKESNAEIEKMHAENEQKAIDRANRIRGSTAEIQAEMAKEEEDNLKASEDRKAQIKNEAHLADMIRIQTQAQERQEAQFQIDMAEQAYGEEKNLKLLEAEKAMLDVRYNQAKTDQERLAILKEKGAKDDQIRVEKLKLYEQKVNEEKLKGYSTFFNGLSALSDSKNKQIAAVAKGAAITSATIDAYLAIQKTLASVPYPANIAAAAGIGVQAFANVAKIAGVQLAEGGIVRATPGGVQATIGEGGQDEAVIPLDRAGEMGFGGGSATIVFNGPILADESQAMAFAKVIDKSLLKLRQTGQSVAFETDIF